VRAKVPSNVAFQISVLDASGRRLPNFPTHNAWLQLRPGEEMKCTGCHRPTPQVGGQNGATPPSGVSHGRSGLFAKAYSGSTSGGTFGAAANATFIAAAAGDTMAKARAGWSCGNEQCLSITPSVNLVSGDVWPTGNDPHAIVPPAPPAAPRAADVSTRYIGLGGLKTKLPTSSSCASNWTSLCRIVINYLDHMQPMWEVSRPVLDAMGMPVLDPTTMQPIDHMCTGCHTRTDAANATRVPAGQLELNADASDADPDHANSYDQLLFEAQVLELNGTALQPHCLQFQTDPTTNVTTCVQFATRPGSMSAGSARNSTRFFQTMEQGSVAGGTMTVDHRTFMSAGELKLVSEWLDIGAQYYNDPFKAPVN
jgi:hypothetical protein